MYQLVQIGKLWLEGRLNAARTYKETQHIREVFKVSALLLSQLLPVACVGAPWEQQNLQAASRDHVSMTSLPLV